MMPDFPLMPPQASHFALQSDILLFCLTGMSLVISVGIFLTIIFLGIRFRKKEGGAFEPSKGFESLSLEITWSVIPLVVGIGIFFWGAILFFDAHRLPEKGTALDIQVVGKQWMWKIQHPNGRTLTNELRIPTGRPIQITMTSQDVIHSFFLPAFRQKQDALPGKYTTMWVEANKTGTFPLFCAEYCGTEHSRMIGKVVVMDPAEYEQWLAGTSTLSPVAAGEQLFTRLGCVTCHAEGPTQRGPSLNNLYLSDVKMNDGSTVLADEEYIRNSIVNPMAHIVANYTPLMPAGYDKQLTDEEMMHLVAYIKQLGNKE